MDEKYDRPRVNLPLMERPEEVGGYFSGLVDYVEAGLIDKDFKFLTSDEDLKGLPAKFDLTNREQATLVMEKIAASVDLLNNRGLLTEAHWGKLKSMLARVVPELYKLNDIEAEADVIAPVLERMSQYGAYEEAGARDGITTLFREYFVGNEDQMMKALEKRGVFGDDEKVTPLAEAGSREI